MNESTKETKNKIILFVEDTHKLQLLIEEHSHQN